jgi:hypothetical protein
MIIRAVVVVVLSTPALGLHQSLGEIARKTEESRKATANPAVKLDQRDIDPRVDDPELLEFRFDQAKWERLVAADVWTTQAIDRNPALYERLASARVQNVRALERLFAREPELAAALKSAGCDPHEFAYANGALAISSMIAMNRDLSPEVFATIPPVIRANVEFIRAHMAEVQAMAARANQLKSRMEKKTASR